jgi:predicted Rossmann fold nucleotide-binding protein DprA/Smf involved in DNA uptake
MVVEAEPDVAAAMDILSFALYHENNQVIGDKDVVPPGQKRQRDVTNVSDPEDDENDPKRQRDEVASQEQGGNTTLAELKKTIYQELSRSLEESLAIDDIATTVDVDRDMVLQAIHQLEAESKIMRSEDGEVYLID